MNTAQNLKNLYRDTVLEHSRQPRNFSRLEQADRTAVGHNPLCGDKITIYMKLKDDRIEEITFEATGCAISIASASVMTESVKHKDLNQAQLEAAKVINALNRKDGACPNDGDMAAFDSVREFPSRIKCASLAWKTLESALHDSVEKVTTED